MTHVWPLERPLVHGYLCVERPDEPQVAGWCQQFARFCVASGYRLGGTFIDREVPTGSLVRIGFIELLAALRVPGTYAALVPSLRHLSTEGFVQQTLAHMVRLTGSQLLITGTLSSSISSPTPLSLPDARP